MSALLPGALAIETPRVSEVRPLTESNPLADLDRNVAALRALRLQATHSFDQSVPPASYADLFRPRDIGRELMALVGDEYRVTRVIDDVTKRPGYQISSVNADAMRPLERELELALGDTVFVASPDNPAVLTISERDAARILVSETAIDRVQSLLTSNHASDTSDVEPHTPEAKAAPNSRTELKP